MLATSLPKPRLNIREMAENIAAKAENAQHRRVYAPDADAVLAIPRLYTKKGDLTKALDEKRRARSVLQERIRNRRDPEAKQAALKEAQTLKEDVAGLEEQLAEVEEDLFNAAINLPNDSHPDVKTGEEVTVLSQHGPEPLPPSPRHDHLIVVRDSYIVLPRLRSRS